MDFVVNPAVLFMAGCLSVQPKLKKRTLNKLTKERNLMARQIKAANSALEKVIDSNKLARLVDNAESRTNTAAVKKLINFIRKELL